MLYVLCTSQVYIKSFYGLRLEMFFQRHRLVRWRKEKSCFSWILWIFEQLICLLPILLDFCIYLWIAIYLNINSRICFTCLCKFLHVLDSFTTDQKKGYHKGFLFICFQFFTEQTQFFSFIVVKKEHIFHSVTFANCF